MKHTSTIFVTKNRLELYLLRSNQFLMPKLVNVFFTEKSEFEFNQLRFVLKHFSGMLKDDNRQIREQAAQLIIDARENESEAVAREIEKVKGLTKTPG